MPLCPLEPHRSPLGAVEKDNVIHLDRQQFHAHACCFARVTSVKDANEPMSQPCVCHRTPRRPKVLLSTVGGGSRALEASSRFLEQRVSSNTFWLAAPHWSGIP